MLFKKVEQSVDAIMATFTETINKLTEHASGMDQRAAQHEEEIRNAVVNKAKAQTEASKARNIAEKLSDILK